MKTFTVKITAKRVPEKPEFFYIGWGESGTKINLTEMQFNGYVTVEADNVMDIIAEVKNAEMEDETPLWTEVKVMDWYENE